MNLTPNQKKMAYIIGGVILLAIVTTILLNGAPVYNVN